MPRGRVPHFKVRTSIKNHSKMAKVWADNDLTALWLRLGIECVERFADRTDDTIIVQDRELLALTGKGRADVARRLLVGLADLLVISASRDGQVWTITFRNFAKRQGFTREVGTRTVPSPSPSPTPSPTTTIEHPPDAPGGFQLEMQDEGKPPETEAKPEKPSSAVTSRLDAAAWWPALVERAAKHGKVWAAAPGKRQLELVAVRIRAGATLDELLGAIDGFVALHSDRLDDGDRPMRKFLRATTVFQASKFEDYLEARADLTAPDARRRMEDKAEETSAERARQWDEDHNDRDDDDS